MQYDGSGGSVPSCVLPAGGPPGQNTTCTVSIAVPTAIPGPAMVYYELTNFYQNHRRYVKSRSDPQLAGTVFTQESQLADCDPLRSRGGRLLHPCGLVANSYFNDTFRLTSPAGAVLDETGITWDTDRAKFKAIDAATIAANPGIIFINETYPGVGNVDNEHFIVWMRPAALPTFRKLYGRIPGGVPAGSTLTFVVRAAYPVNGFDGKKALVVANTSWMGGKNAFLGLAYIVVGFMCVAAAAAFGARQALGGRKLGDPSFLVYHQR